MSDLNSRLCTYVQLHWRGPIEVEYLLDNNIPEIPDKIYKPIGSGIQELFIEIEEHTNSTRRRIKTKLTEGLLTIELAWDGRILTPGTICYINERYGKGRASPKNTWEGGTFVAGFEIGSAGGSVRIENCSEGVYVARNVVEIPRLFE